MDNDWGYERKWTIGFILVHLAIWVIVLYLELKLYGWL